MRNVAIIFLFYFSLVFTQFAGAFSFNNIEVRSYVGQPLNARIFLTEYADESASNYQVTLGTSHEFDQQKLARPTYLKRLNFKIVTDQHKAPYLAITSNQPIKVSNLQLLIAVTPINGEETQLFKIKLAIQPSPLYMKNTKQYSNMGNENNTLTYGPTTIKDNLQSIANEMRPDKSVSPNQMMLAIVKRNPQAFYQQNVNGLQAGRTLEMPSMMMILSFTPDFADREVARQNAQWQDILKQQTHLKQYDGQELQLAEEQLQLNQITQQKIEKITQKPTSTNSSSIRPAHLIVNEFSMGYGQASFYSVVDYPGTYQQLRTSKLEFIRLQDRLYAPLAKIWYIEGSAGFDYYYTGHTSANVYTDTTQQSLVEQPIGKNVEAGGYNANIGFGYPININGDFYHATVQIIPVIGAYYNAQDLQAPEYRSVMGPLSIDNEWYGLWSGLETRLRFNKLDAEADIKYYTGYYSSAGTNFAESATTSQSAKAYGVEVALNLAYAFAPRWQLLLGYDAQKFQAKSGNLVAADVKGSTDQSVWRTQYVTVGIKSKF